MVVYITLEELEQLAFEYIKNCIEATKEIATNSGKAIEIKERHIPTINYFLYVWIPLINKKDSISKSTYYSWLNGARTPEHSDAIKKIDELFKSLAVDIVANEGKGIFYAKNRLDMTDRSAVTTTIEQPLFNEIPEDDSNK